ncbi:GNAT family N-acetyltransferase [Paenibacillus protaetiae]|uniref:GNAT family N-acetyltransferase n=1 Tax=Paenibacillus protaetiae TaxID=2509456 RepID=A0A4V0YFL9_9BACL|nr:GNAT family N-acetyltransferase [Paenibacillus protaetiae]QAY68171.1 GNAT family N-acetyltransferase [Paenibacillus protaetiae]
MVEVIRVETKEQLDEAYRIRMNVFVEEQGVSADVEIDEHEDECVHVLAYYNGQPAGVGRVRALGEYAKLERICVLAEFRKYGIGKAIVAKLEQVGREQLGLPKAKLNGQTHAEPFYAKLGYETVSDVFMEEGIPHVTMVKKLA